MILLIDNYDSFTYNLYHLFGAQGCELEVWRNDKISVDEALAMKPDGIIISPGPCRPEDGGIIVDLVKKAAGLLPVFGVCLGYQAIVHALGGKIVRANKVMHGKTSSVSHDGSGVFSGIPAPFHAARYHSLVAEPAFIPDELLVNAQSENGVIMGIRHRELPIHGVQFHPESIATEYGTKLALNFLSLCRPKS